MHTIRFGRSGLSVSRVSFGAIPIQRLTVDQSTALLCRAYEGGVTLYDTARVYTDSEEKIGIALGDVRKNIILTTKTPSLSRSDILSDIETSLKSLRTDYIDVYQLHDPHMVSGPGDESYETLLELKQAGKIRFIGLTNHDLNRAEQAVRSGYYDTVQFPLSPLSSERELALPALCMEHDVGLLAMKALSGGLITRWATSFVFLRNIPTWCPSGAFSTCGSWRSSCHLKWIRRWLSQWSCGNKSSATERNWPVPSAGGAGIVSHALRRSPSPLRPACHFFCAGPIQSCSRPRSGRPKWPVSRTVRSAVIAKPTAPMGWILQSCYGASWMGTKNIIRLTAD